MEQELAELTEFPINAYTITYMVAAAILFIAFAIYRYKTKIDVDASDKNIRELLIDISRPETERREELLLILKKRGVKVISSGVGYIEFYKEKEFNIWKFLYLTAVYIVPGIWYAISRMAKKKHVEVYDIKLSPADKLIAPEARAEMEKRAENR